MRRFARLARAASLCLALWPCRAGAEALYLNWDECGPTGPALHTSDCSAETGEQRLYCAFSLDQPVDQVLGVEIVVDVQHAEEVLPPWWQLGVGGCRYGALTASGGVPDGIGCVDAWQGKAAGSIQGFAVGQPYGGPNQARIRAALAVLPADARSLDAGTVYYAARLILSNQGTVGAASCSGCQFSACLVLNTIVVKRLPGAPGGDVTVSVPAAGNGNFATWQGSGANCAAVPITRSSWGRIKSLYR